MIVRLSVENKCKFCEWKITDEKRPTLICEEDGKVFAFCPMCDFELDIAWREIKEIQ